MRWPSPLVATALAGVTALAACAGAEANTAPPTPPPPPVVAAIAPTSTGFFPGESMSFDVGLGGITGGEAQLAVGQPGDFEGHRAIVVTSRAVTAGAVELIKHVSDEATTVIDLDRGVPLQLDTVVEYGDKRSTAHARFADKAVDVTFARAEETTPHQQHINYGGTGVLDAHAAMAQIRIWKPAAGASRSVWVIGGRRLWRVDVHYLGNDTINSALGSRRVVHFDGEAYKARNNLTVAPGKPERTFSVWLTDDADRVPLKVTAHTELGDVTIALTDYNRP